VIRLAIFDLDGTLIDTPNAIVSGFTDTLAALGAAPRTPAEIRATVGLPLQRAFETLLGPEGRHLVNDAAAHYLEIYRERIVPTAADLVFPGVAEGLARLAGQGVHLAVATNKTTAGAELILDSAGLLERFTQVYGADRVAKPKPDPEVCTTAVKAYGVLPHEAVMVGDTTHDLHAAEAAGIASIAVTYGVQSTEALLKAHPTWCADTFGQVVSHILDP